MPNLIEWLDGIVTIDSNGLPVFKRMPTVEELHRIKPSDPEGQVVLHRLQAMMGNESAEQIRRAQIKYLERFNITPSSPLYQQQLANLNTTVNSAKVLTATSRRVTHDSQLATMLEGKDKTCIYINEGEDPCDTCEPLGGQVEKYSWFVENNLIPGEQCLGGLSCLCILVPSG
jgi:hypothetical protein